MRKKNKKFSREDFERRKRLAELRNLKAKENANNAIIGLASVTMLLLKKLTDNHPDLLGESE